MKDYLIRGIDESGNIRVFVARTTNLVEEARRRHQTAPTASAALGRTLTAASIMGAMMKNEKDSLTLKINGGGIAGNILGVANNRGEVKGYIDNPGADLPNKDNGKLDVSGIVGLDGYLSVAMDLGLREPYVGQSNLISGEIAEDIAYYYLMSDQQPSAVSLGVLVDKDISIRAAGGYIIQLLPGVSDEDIDKIEERLKEMAPMSSLIDMGLSPEEILEKLFPDFNMTILDKQDISFKCDCSFEKLEKVLKSIGKEEIKNIIEEDGQAEIVCHFCNSKYNFSRENLEKLLVDKD